MSLSTKNINYLNFDAYYICSDLSEVDVVGLDKKRDDLYWCFNNVFYVVKEGNEYYMVDTYWNSFVDSKKVKLTDDNIKFFDFVMDRDKVEQIRREDAHLYKKVYRLALDSGGRNNYRCFVDEDAEEETDYVLLDYDNKIDSLEKELETLKRSRENYVNSL